MGLKLITESWYEFKNVFCVLLQRPFPKNFSFPCDISAGRSQVRPTSVHKLKAGDIDVVAGLGDSLMCNNGAAASNVSTIKCVKY